MEISIINPLELQNPFVMKQLEKYNHPEAPVSEIIASEISDGNPVFFIKDGSRVVGIVGAMQNVVPGEWVVRMAVGDYEEFPKDTGKQILSLLEGAMLTTSATNDSSTGFAECIGMEMTGTVYVSDTRSLRVGPAISEQFIRLDYDTFPNLSSEQTAEVVALITAGIKEESLYDTLGMGYDIPLLVEGIKSKFNEGEAIGAVLVVDGKYAGVIVARVEGETCYGIHGMYVLPEHRLNGYASEMVRVVAHFFNECDVVRAGTLADNEASQCVFERLGFSKEQTLYHVSGK